jgi:hypothetical protein
MEAFKCKTAENLFSNPFVIPIYAERVIYVQHTQSIINKREMWENMISCFTYVIRNMFTNISTVIVIMICAIQF